MSGVVGLSFVDIEWIPTAITSTQPLPSGLLTGLDQITAAIAREVGRLADIRGAFVPGDYRLGMAGMTDQFSVDVGVDDQGWIAGVSHDAAIVPVAIAFAQHIRDRGLHRFGALPLPLGGEDALVASDELSGVTMRGIRAFLPGHTYMRPIYKEAPDDTDDDDLEIIGEEPVEVPPRWMPRFDIIGGQAPTCTGGPAEGWNG